MIGINDTLKNKRKTNPTITKLEPRKIILFFKGIFCISPPVTLFPLSLRERLGEGIPPQPALLPWGEGNS